MGLFSRKKKQQPRPEGEQTPVLQQDLSKIQDFSGVYFMRLLFCDPLERLPIETVHQALQSKFGAVDVVSGDAQLSAFALQDHPVRYKDGVVAPSQLLVGAIEPFDPASVDALNRSQCWDAPNAPALLDTCRYALTFGDFMAGGLPYGERCALLADFAGLMLELYPTCTLLEFLPSGKLLTREAWEKNPYQGSLRFLHGGINLRFFNVQGKEERIVDTLGLCAIGLPDVQCHFHTLKPDEVVRHCCDIAVYLFDKGDIIQDGETVPGLSGEEHWPCRHEMSQIQPSREVLDLQAGSFAAGNRSGE